MVSAQEPTLQSRQSLQSRQNSRGYAFICSEAGVEINYGWIKWNNSNTSRHISLFLYLGTIHLYYGPHVWLVGTRLLLQRKHILKLFLLRSYYTGKTNWSLMVADKAVGHQAAALCFVTTCFHVPPKAPSATAWRKLGISFEAIHLGSDEKTKSMM